MRHVMERARRAMRDWLNAPDKLTAMEREQRQRADAERASHRLQELQDLVRAGRALRADEMALLKLMGSKEGLSFLRANSPEWIARREAARREAAQQSPEMPRCPARGAVETAPIPPAAQSTPRAPGNS